MAGKSAVMSVRIVADAKQASGEIGKFEQALGKIDGAMSKATPVFAAAGGGLVAFGATAASAAAEAEQNFGAVNTVFDDSAQKIHEWAASAAQDVGLASSDYESLAASIGGSLSKAGYSQDELASKTNDLISAGADLSSVFGGDAAGAAEAMGAALRGEFDSLEQYGVFMSASAVEARMAAEGTDKLTGAAYDAAKQQATVNEIMEQAGQYAGNFASEADTAAGAQQRAKAAAENAAATLGQALLPYLTQGANLLAQFAGWVMQNEQTVVKFAAGIGVAVAAFFAARGAIVAVQTAMQIWTGVQWALNAAMAANPIALVVIAIAALVAGVVWAYNNVEWFRQGVDAALEWVKNAWSAAADWVGTTWNAAVEWVVSKFTAVTDGAANAAQWTADKWNAGVEWVKNTWNAGVDWVVAKFLDLVFGAIAAGQRVSDAFNSAVEWVRSTWQAGIDFVLGFIRSVYEVGYDIGLKVREALAQPASYIAEKFGAMGEKVRGIFENIRGWAQGVRDSVTGLFDNFKMPEMPGWAKDLLGTGDNHESNGAGDWYAPASDLWTPVPFNITAATTPYILAAAGSSRGTVVVHHHHTNRFEISDLNPDPVRTAQKIKTLLADLEGLVGY